MEAKVNRNDGEIPLEEWWKGRQQRRRPVGQRRAITLADGPQHGAHVSPAAPRLILEWDGFAWQPVTVAENYPAACRAVNHSEAARAVPVPGYSPVKGGGGRHRRR
ncbi:hypothetical protein BG452_04975 [Streptomyces sp. CBMA123]|nr:hypothetical protein [Streptomyces sp. CBMA123]